MTAQSDPYVRVYYRIVDDPKFASVYDDDAALALWLRLLLNADAMYPAAAPLPHGVKRAVLQRLVDAELIDIGTGNRYRVHGLAAEREHRSEQSRRAANARWQHSASNAPALRPQSVSNAISEPNRTEPIRSAPTRGAGLTPIRNVLEEKGLLPVKPA